MLGDHTFFNCKELKHVTFASGSRLEAIGTYCFFKSGLEEIAIPNSVAIIGDHAFSSCKNLRKVSF